MCLFKTLTGLAENAILCKEPNKVCARVCVCDRVCVCVRVFSFAKAID